MKTVTDTHIQQQLKTMHVHPLLKIRERSLIWKNAKGTWKNKKIDLDEELKKIRKEWDRKIR